MYLKAQNSALLYSRRADKIAPGDFGKAELAQVREAACSEGQQTNTVRGPVNTKTEREGLSCYFLGREKIKPKQNKKQRSYSLRMRSEERCLHFDEVKDGEKLI